MASPSESHQELPVPPALSAPCTRTTMPLHFVIVGCGLGGLAAAHCLGRVGHTVTVFEAASQIADVGAGIQVDHIPQRRPYLTRRPRSVPILVAFSSGGGSETSCEKPQGYPRQLHSENIRLASKLGGRHGAKIWIEIMEHHTTTRIERIYSTCSSNSPPHI